MFRWDRKNGSGSPGAILFDPPFLLISWSRPSSWMIIRSSFSSLIVSIGRGRSWVTTTFAIMWPPLSIGISGYISTISSRAAVVISFALLLPVTSHIAFAFMIVKVASDLRLNCRRGFNDCEAHEISDHESELMKRFQIVWAFLPNSYWTEMLPSELTTEIWIEKWELQLCVPSPWHLNISLHMLRDLSQVCISPSVNLEFLLLFRGLLIVIELIHWMALSFLKEDPQKERAGLLSVYLLVGVSLDVWFTTSSFFLTCCLISFVLPFLFNLRVSLFRIFFSFMLSWTVVSIATPISSSCPHL